MADKDGDKICMCNHPKRDHYYNALLKAEICGWACGCPGFQEK